MTHAVSFSRQAERQLANLYMYIADAKSPEVAADYVEAIVNFCESLAGFPRRGTARDDLRPGLWTIGFRRRAVVAYMLGRNDDAVTIIGIFYGGRDHESLLAGD